MMYLHPSGTYLPKYLGRYYWRSFQWDGCFPSSPCLGGHLSPVDYAPCIYSTLQPMGCANLYAPGYLGTLLALCKISAPHFRASAPACTSLATLISAPGGSGATNWSETQLHLAPECCKETRLRLHWRYTTKEAVVPEPRRKALTQLQVCIIGAQDFSWLDKTSLHVTLHAPSLVAITTQDSLDHVQVLICEYIC